MDRSNIDKIARTPEDKILLAKVWDKINTGLHRNIPASTCFLSPRELDMARYLFGQTAGLTAFGGYPDAERCMLLYLPDYLNEDFLSTSAPLTAIRASWYAGDSLTHRDLLGALMGAGIARETVGDICMDSASCDFFVTEEIAPYILQNLTSAGRTKLHLQAIPLEQVHIPTPETMELRDTVASPRLDSILSSGFRISRSLATQSITAGKVMIDGLPCEKPDRTVPEGARISLRGLGKIKLRTIGGQTKKGRTAIIIDKYM